MTIKNLFDKNNWNILETIHEIENVCKANLIYVHRNVSL